MTYQNWNAGEPNNWGDGEDCVEMFVVEHARGLWNDHFCTDKNEYICQIYTTTDHPKIQLDKMWPEGECKAGWWKMGKACYRVFASAHSTDPNPVDTQARVQQTVCTGPLIDGPIVGSIFDVRL